MPVRHPSPLASGLPAQVLWAQWALMQGINAEIKRQDADDKVGGNIIPIYILTLMAAAGGFIAIWLNLEHQPKLIPVTLPAIGTGLVIVTIYRLQGFLLRRALHSELSEHVPRNLRYTGQEMVSLIHAAVGLGKGYEGVVDCSKWAQKRTLYRFH